MFSIKRSRTHLSSPIIRIGLVSVLSWQCLHAETICDQVTEVSNSQCQALVALYDSTNGDNWANNTGWNNSNTPCSWFGVTCGNGDVTKIELNVNNLSGTLPELSAFTNLQTLSLYRNNLTGSIPKLSTLTDLQAIFLYENQLSGSIPALDTLTNLQALHLHVNQLSGSIPALSTLTQLQTLYLNKNQLTGSIPNLSNLTNLKVLSLKYNDLTDTIPSLSNLSNLTTLWLEGNSLTGSIPDFSGLTSLTGMHLSANNLTGSIPDLSSLVVAHSIYLSDNQLTGSIPNLSSVSNLWNFSVANNQLSGEIPSLASLSRLETFGLSGNSGFCRGSNVDYAGHPEVEPFPICGNPNITLTRPIHGATDIPISGQVFTWAPDPVASAHRIVISTRSDFAGFTEDGGASYCNDTMTCLTASDTGMQDYTVTINLPENTTFYWKVRASRNPTFFSEVHSFMTGVAPKTGCNGDIDLPDNLCEGLTAYYPMDGNANDASGNGSNGEVNGATLTTDRLGNENSAYAFDGVNNYISIADSPQVDFAQSQNFAVAFWVKVADIQPFTASGDNDIIEKWDGKANSSSYSYVIRLLNQTHKYHGKIVVARYDGDNNAGFGSTVTVNDDQFHHIVFVKDGDQLQLFVDGSLDATSTDRTVGNTTSDSPLFLGRRGSPLKNQFKGVIDDLIIYNRALTAPEIQAYYNSTTTAETNCNAVTEIPTAQCEALVALYDSTDGDNWTDNTGWNNSNTPCSWFGVTCADSAITKIELGNNNLTGSIPELSALTSLTYLLLDNNQLSGSIPELSALTNLQHLYLYSNQLNGSIPELSALTSLANFNLVGNQLSGTIPDLSTLTSLRYLNLSGNQLSGSIPELNALTNLQYLHLETNKLTGTIPELSTLTNLTVLYLSYNQLSGSIPNFSDLTNLQTLSLNNNQLTGPFPDVSALTQLKWLKFGDNLLSGPIPDLSSLTNLEVLYLSNAQFSGPIPALNTLTKLTTLGLSGNPQLCQNPNADYASWTEVNKFLNCNDPNYGLVAYYPFEGNANDGSGNENHGTEKGGFSYVTGKIGQAAQFDGVDDYVEIANSAELELNRYVTISYLIAPQKSSGSIPVVMKNSHTGNNYSSWINGNLSTVWFQQYPQESGPNFTFAKKFTVTEGEFIHVVMVRNDSSVKTYVNGTLLQEYVADYDARMKKASLYIGYDGGYGYRTFKGLIDDVRIYNRALSESEIQTLHNAANPVVAGCNGNIQLADNLCEGLTAYYSMNGNANDASGNGNNGTVNGATLTTDRHGIADNAYSFDGTDDYIQIADSISLDIENQLSISAWIKPQDITTNSAYEIARKTSGNNSGYLFSFQHGTQLTIGINDSFSQESDTPITSSDLVDEQWHLVVGTYDGTEFKVYVDGTLVEAKPLNQPIATNDAPLFIGSYNGTMEFFDGAIDDVIIHNRALSASEIQSHYNSTKPATTGCNGDIQLPSHLCDGLTLYMPMDGNANDVSGNGNNGIVNGATLTTDRLGNENSAYAFDGVNNYISIADSPQVDFAQSQDFVVAFWVKPADIQPDDKYGDNDIVEKWSGSEKSYPYTIRYYNATGHIGFNRYDGTDFAGVLSNTLFNDSEFHYVAAVKNGDTLQLYVDGQLENQETDTITGETTNNSPLFLGRRGNDTARNLFKGVIDDLFIYNRALTASEIQTHYDSGKPATTGCNGDAQLPDNLCEGLVAYLPLDGNPNDESGNGHDGIVHGATLTEDRFGNHESAYHFDGESHYIKVADAPGLSGFQAITLSAWFYKEELQDAFAGIVTKWFQQGANVTREQDTYAMYINNDNSIHGYTNNNCCEGAVGSFPAEQWVYATFIHTNDEGGKVYINGQLVGSLNSTGAIIKSTNPVIIGAGNHKGRIWRFFKGKIDDVRIYNRALTDAEIKTHYDDSKPASQSMLENAEDGDTDGWRISGEKEGGAAFANVFDEERNSRVMEFTGSPFSAYNFVNPDGSPLSTTNFIARWNIKITDGDTANPYFNKVYWRVKTSGSVIYLSYGSHKVPLGCHLDSSEKYATCNLGSDLQDGTWHSITRDLEADLKAVAPDLEILEIDHLQVNMAGRIDDIQLLNRDVVNFHTISGTITDNEQGVSDKSLSNTGADCQPSDNQGNFTCTVPEEWYGSLTPKNTNTHYFAPLTRAYNKVSEDITEQDFTMILIDDGLEDAEDGDTDGWYISANPKGDSAFANVFDSEKNSRVMEFTGHSRSTYQFIFPDGSPLSTNKFIARWDMKMATGFGTVFWRVKTTGSVIYMEYRLNTPLGCHLSSQSNYAICGMGDNVPENTWYTITRDFKADLKTVGLEDIELQSVEYMLVHTAGRVDNIQLLESLPTKIMLEDAEDGDTENWNIFYEKEGGAAFTNVFDEDRNSQVIDFAGNPDSAYRFIKPDGSPLTTNNFIARWSMNIMPGGIGNPHIDKTFWQVKTTGSVSYMEYRTGLPLGCNNNNDEHYAVCGLGYELRDGKWHNITRDLKADLKAIAPDIELLSVEHFQFNMVGRVDDIQLLNHDVVNFHTISGTATNDIQDISDQSLVKTGADCQPFDNKGNFTCLVPEGWYGALMPENSNEYYFAPFTRMYSEVSENLTEQNFTAQWIADGLEDAEDGDTQGWSIYDNTHGEAAFANVVENENNRVIELTGHTSSGYQFGFPDGTPFSTTRFIAQWRMKKPNATDWQPVYWRVKTSGEVVYIEYHANGQKGCKLDGTGKYIICVVGANMPANTWHTFTRDLEADLKTVKPDLELQAVEHLKIRMDGQIDDIKLLESIPTETVLEDAEDGNAQGLEIAEDYNASFSIVFDEEKESQVLEFQGEAKSRYTLKRSDGTSFNETNNFIVQWSAKGRVGIASWAVETDSTVLHIDYSAYNRLGCHLLESNPAYVNCGIDMSMGDGTWHTFTRNLKADLKAAVPDANLHKIHYFNFRAGDGGRLDDIKLLNPDVVPSRTISGKITAEGKALNGVTFSSSGAECQASDNNGDFTCLVPEGWFGTLVPENTNEYYFAPFTRNYSEVSENITGQNFIVKLIADGLEDAEDGDTQGWSIYDNTKGKAAFANVVENENNRVIELTGATSSGYTFAFPDGTPFSTTRFIAQWRMKMTTTDHQPIYWRVKTTGSVVLLQYNANYLGCVKQGTEYIICGLGENMPANKWHTITRDLKADLKALIPDLELLEVEQLHIRMVGQIDDIKLLEEMPATDCTAVTEIPAAQCETLVALYEKTEGNNWTNNVGWNITNTPCSWYSIECTDGNVTKIDLSDNKLSGTIPELSSLTSLMDLRLYSNQLTGSIPELSALTKLHTLFLNNNQLSGLIPDLSALTEMQMLYLALNKLSGTVPELTALTKLQELDFSHNKLTGSIPKLSTLINLQGLRLANNQLSGPIPSLDSLPKLESFDLSGDDNKLCQNLEADYAGRTEVEPFEICPDVKLIAEASTTEVCIGRDLTVTIKKQLAQTVNQIQMVLSYDTNLLKVNTITNAGTLTQFNANDDNGTIQIEAGNFTGISDEFDIATLQLIPLGTSLITTVQFNDSQTTVKLNGTILRHASEGVIIAIKDCLPSEIIIEPEEHSAIWSFIDKSAELNAPKSISFDSTGNAYIADSLKHRILKRDTQGNITVVAGTRVKGFAGDNGPAIEAKLNNPQGIAIDGEGNLYIADTDNHRIRKIDSSGIITTVVGNGKRGFAGDKGLATAAKLRNPVAIVFDNNGHLYIADKGNHRIRKVTGQRTRKPNANSMITTFAGSRSGYRGDNAPAIQARLSNPSGLAVDSQNNLYIADTDNHRIRKVDNRGNITTVAGNGTKGYSGDGDTAIAAKLNAPTGIEVDNAGNIFIADKDNHRVRKVNNNGMISTFTGNGKRGNSTDGILAGVAQINQPTDVALDQYGNLYIADKGNNLIRKVGEKEGETGEAPPHEIADCPNTEITGISESECYALIALYDSTNGPEWTNNDGWKATDTPCEWTGVTCANGSVTEINLNDNNLVGDMPDQIGGLPNLEQLNLNDNQISGAIPTTIEHLNKLETLNLANNDLTGSLPVELGDATNLQTVNLANNQISGEIPNLSPLTQMQDLNLSENRFSGAVPDLTELSALQTIEISGENQPLCQDSDTKVGDLPVGNLDECPTSNQLPTAAFTTTPNKGEAPLTVQLDARSSYDPYGNITAYFWESSDKQVLMGPTPTITFQKSGTYEIKLRVMDHDGAPSINVAKHLIEVSPSPEQATLTLDKDGMGLGTISIRRDKEPAITCKSDCEEKSQDYPIGSEIKLTAKAVMGSLFTGWRADCVGTEEDTKITVTMDSAKQCTAVFELEPTPPPAMHALTINSVAAEFGSGGTIEVRDIVCQEPPCLSYHQQGKNIKITGTPIPHAHFIGWNHTCPVLGEFTDATNLIVLTSDATCIAYFGNDSVPASEDTAQEFEEVAELSTGESVTEMYPEIDNRERYEQAFLIAEKAMMTAETQMIIPGEAFWPDQFDEVEDFLKLPSNLWVKKVRIVSSEEIIGEYHVKGQYVRVDVLLLNKEGEEEVVSILVYYDFEPTITESPLKSRRHRRIIRHRRPWRRRR